MAAPAFGSAGTYLAGTASTMSVAVPSGVASGDIIVVFAYVDSTATITAMPSGFAQATGSPQSVTNQAHRFYVAWKRASGADSGTYDFTLSTSIYREAVAVRYTGAVTSGDPWDAVNAAAQNRDVSTSTPAVSVTTTGADRLLIFAATYWAGGAWTPPSGYTERVDNSGEFTVDDLAQAVAGSSGSVSTTVASSTFSTTAWLGALAPPGGASTVNGTGALTGAGTLSAAVVQRASATLTGAGSLTASVVQGGAAVPAGAGSLSALATQRATVALTGAGVLAAAGSSSAGTGATLTAAGVLSATATQGSSVALAGAGTLSAPVIQAGKATLAGVGGLTASASALGAVVKATSTAAITARRTSADTVLAARSSTTAVTARATSSGGVT